MKLTKTQIAELKAFPFGPARVGASKELCDWINKILNEFKLLEDRAENSERMLRFIGRIGGTKDFDGLACAAFARGEL